MEIGPRVLEKSGRQTHTHTHTQRHSSFIYTDDYLEKSSCFNITVNITGHEHFAIHIVVNTCYISRSMGVIKVSIIKSGLQGHLRSSA